MCAKAAFTAEVLNSLSEYEHQLGDALPEVAKQLIIQIEQPDDEIISADLPMAQEILERVKTKYEQRQHPNNLVEFVFSRPLRNIRDAQAIRKAEKKYRGIWQPTELHQKTKLLYYYSVLYAINKSLTLGVGPTAAILIKEFPANTFEVVLFIYTLAALTGWHYEKRSIEKVGYAVNVPATISNLVFTPFWSTLLTKVTLAPQLALTKAVLDGTASQKIETGLIAHMTIMIVWHMVFDIAINRAHLKQVDSNFEDSDDSIEVDTDFPIEEALAIDISA